MSDEKLKSCPWCGGNGVISYSNALDYHSAYCDNPDCGMSPETHGFESYFDAANTWNRRTP